MKAVLLCRVSTEQQDYEAQIRDLKKYAIKKGASEVHVIAKKESGFKKIDEREGWNEAKIFFENNKDYNCLVVTEISRLGRRDTAIAEIKEFCETHKLSLFIKDIDLQLYEYGQRKPESDIVFAVFQSIAVNEMSQKKERFRRSKENLTSQGYSIGGKVLFGYKRVFDEKKGKNKFVPDEKTSKEVVEVYNKYLEGGGIKQLVVWCIGRGMSRYLHSNRNVTKMLSEVAYTGQKGNVPYPVIISKELFNQVQEKKANSRIISDKQTKHTTLLSKLIQCPICGTFLGGDYREGRPPVYRCNKHKKGNCENSSVISMNFVDSVVYSFLKENIRKLIEERRKVDVDKTISDIKKEIERLENRKSELSDELKSGSVIFRMESKILGIEEAKNRYEKLTKRVERDLSVVNSGLFKKEKEIEEIKKGMTPVTEEELDNLDRINLYELLHKIVKKVVINNNRKMAFFSIELVGDFHHHLVVVYKGKEIKCFGAKDVDTNNLEEIVFENMIGGKDVEFNEFKFNRI
jgi:DNA invertase Pin-like site-specific DNA recombinase